MKTPRRRHNGRIPGFLPCLIRVMIDPDRLVRLLDNHAAALELFAAQWTDQPADIVQEAFLRLAEQSPIPDRILAWLYRVVRNTALSAARSESRRVRHERAAAEFRPPWFRDNGQNAIDAQAATQALRELPAEQREIVVARIWGGLSFEEIGRLVGVSSSTAHRRYLRALGQLRKQLGVTCKTNCETMTS